MTTAVTWKMCIGGALSNYKWCWGCCQQDQKGVPSQTVLPSHIKLIQYQIFFVPVTPSQLHPVSCFPASDLNSSSCAHISLIYNILLHLHAKIIGNLREQGYKNILNAGCAALLYYF